MLYLVPTPIGNIADISLRALEIFSKADKILCEDTRITKQLLYILQERYPLELQQNIQFLSFHSHNEKEFLSKIESSFFDDEVVYVSDAGMPGISDPGASLVVFAQQNNLQYDVLPGANAVLTAYVASGFYSKEFLFYGFLPHKLKEKESQLQKAILSGYVTIFYESPHRLLKFLDIMEKIDNKREIFLAKELTKRYQTYLKGDAKTLKQELGNNIKGEWVIVVSANESTAQSGTISQEDIQQLDIPKKQKAKLLSKITGKSVKELYNDLLFC